MLFKSRKKYSIIFYLPTRNMHPPKLFNRARTKPCFFLSRLAKIYARPRIPQAVPAQLKNLRGKSDKFIYLLRNKISNSYGN